MHILAFILMFIVGSIIAACSGDFSGLAAIGKIVGFFCAAVCNDVVIYTTNIVSGCNCDGDFYFDSMFKL